MSTRPARPQRLAQATARSSRAEVRAAILSAARALLEQGALRELSVDLLMERVGMSRTAFYRYFDDLGTLVQALLADAIRPLEQAAEQLASGTGGAAEQDLRGALASVVAVFAEHGPIIAATVAAAHYDATMEQVIVAARERFAQLTAAGLRARSRAADVDIPDPVETARALGAMNEGYLLNAFGGVRRVEPAQALEALWPPWRQLLYRPSSAPGS